MDIDMRELYIQERQKTAIIQALAGDFVAFYYVDEEDGSFDIYRKSPDGSELLHETTTQNYFECVISNGRKHIVPEDFEQFMEKFNKHTIVQALKTRKSYAVSVRVMYLGEETYFQYRAVRPVIPQEEHKLIIGVYNVDEETRKELARQKQIHDLKQQAQVMMEYANKDVLTGLFNRRCYEHDLHLEDIFLEHFVFVMADVNGLKKVNDTFGHDAGDELIQGAAYCLNRSMGGHGKVYRIGGDEFAVIMYASESETRELYTDLMEMVQNWSGHRIDALSLSVGIVAKNEFPDATISEITALADKRMYDDKNLHYKRCGDRQYGLGFEGSPINNRE